MLYLIGEITMDDLDFPTTSLFEKNDVKKVQLRLLEMAKITAEILDRNGIQYSIAYGTLLGAVRHKGFIPWDHDFDFFLFDDGYGKALEALRKELPKDILVHDRQTDPIYWPSWAKVRDLNSIVSNEKYPDEMAYRFHGIHLDLYYLKKIKRSKVDVYIKREAIEFLVRKYDAGLIRDDVYDQTFAQWSKEYVDILGDLSKQNDSDEEVYNNLSWIKEIEIDHIFPLKKYDFEDTQFWGPNNYDAILSQFYGDYMTIPEFEKRQISYDYVEFLKD